MSFLRPQRAARVLALLPLLIWGCDQAQASEQSSSESLYGLRLKAHKGLPDVEVAVRIAPALTQIVEPTQATAQVVADAFQQCASSDGAALEAPLSLDLRLERGNIAPSTQAGASSQGVLPECLARAIVGKPLLPGDLESRSLTIQLARGTR